MVPRTLWQTITHFPLHTDLHYFAPRIRWHIRTIRSTRVLPSSQGLQLCCSRWHDAWRCLCFASADSHMPHSHLCLAWGFCHLLQCSLRFGSIACGCICFAIIVFYMSEIYCPIITLANTMPSVHQIVRWSIIGMRCSFLLIRIPIVTILALIPSVSNGSKSPGRFRVQFRPGSEPSQQVLPHENPDRCHWAGFTSKNPAFQVHNFRCN